MHRHARRSVAAALAVASVALAATSASPSLGAPSGAAGHTALHSGSSSLTWWVFYRPLLTLDPLKFEDYPENTILGNLCESLLTVTPSYKVVPALASKVDGRNPGALGADDPLRRAVLGRLAAHRRGCRLQPEAELRPGRVASVYGFTFMREVKSVAPDLPERGDDRAQGARRDLPGAPRHRRDGRDQQALRREARRRPRHAEGRDHVHRPVQARKLGRRDADHGRPEPDLLEPRGHGSRAEDHASSGRRIRRPSRTRSRPAPSTAGSTCRPRRCCGCARAPPALCGSGSLSRR